MTNEKIKQQYNLHREAIKLLDAMETINNITDPDCVDENSAVVRKYRILIKELDTLKEPTPADN